MVVNMKMLSLALILLVLTAAELVLSAPTIAQSITPALDGTGTIVTPAGNQFNISGGTQAGANLYQSFQQFGLDSNQIANFLSRPDIQNILGRVVGGDASIINGLVQVTGGNSNLYLMNTAGIIFGANASLNVPASFTATTANGIQVGTNWFKATGANDYATLNGTPSGFAFIQSGAIFNAGTLTVGQGQSLTLVGGTAINLGTIAAPGGQITIAAIPGEKLVRITQAGSLLSLDLPIDTKAQLNSNSSAPLNLPALLTGSTLQAATGVTVDNGVVKLASGTAIPTDPGVAIVSGNVTVAPSLPASITPLLPTSPTPQITILGDKVALLSANLNASSTTGGGTILIGGDYQGKGTVPNAQFTFVDAGSTIAADALTTGNGGKVILWSDQATRFYGMISARGGSQGGNGGLVETSGHVYLEALGSVDTSAVNGSAGTWLLDPNNIIIQTAGVNTNVTASPNFTSTNDSAIVTTGSIQAALNGGTSVTVTTAAVGANTQAGDITVANDIIKTAGGDATLTLSAQNSIFVSNNVQITSTTNRLNVVMTGDIDGNGDGAIVLNPGSRINSNNGNITLIGQGTAITPTGIDVNNATLTAGTGNIQLIGIGQTGTLFPSNGIDIRNGSDIITTGGTITLEGTSGDGFSFNHGVYVRDLGTLITSETGAILLRGLGAGTGTYNVGVVQLGGAEIISTGTAPITLDGIGGQGTDNNSGVLLYGPTNLSSVDGPILIRGRGAGTGNNNSGIDQVLAARVTSTGTATITYEGVGSGVGSTSNYGVTLADSGTAITATTGTIAIKGVGVATGGGNSGINQANGADVVSLGNAPIALEGTGAGTNNGISTTGGGNIIGGTTANGNISLTADRMDISSTTVQSQGNLLLQPLTPSTSIGIGDDSTGTLKLDKPQLDSLENGFNTITIGRADGTGQVTLGNATFRDNLILNASPLGSGTVAFNGSVNFSGNNLTLNTGGTVTQTQPIEVGGLELLGSGSYILNNPNNSINTIAANTTGSISYVDKGGFSIGTVGSTRGIITSGTLTLDAGGTVTQTQPIVAAGLELLGSGSYVLNNPANNVSTIAANTTGSIDYTNAQNLAIATVGTTTGISAPKQSVTLTSLGGNIISAGTTISTSSDKKDAGAITLTAATDILSGDILATSSRKDGGNITLTSTNGSVTTGLIDTQGKSGGTVTIAAAQQINTGAIDTSGTSKNGGNVTINSSNSVQVVSINAQGGKTGRGGDVQINKPDRIISGFVQVTGSFIDQDGVVASVSTTGGKKGDGGTVTIYHGGNGVTPFKVGGAMTNGTAAAITTGDNTIAPIQAFPDSYTQRNIRLSTDAPPRSTVTERADLVQQLQEQAREQIRAGFAVNISLEAISSLGNTQQVTEANALEKTLVDEYTDYLGVLAEAPDKVMNVRLALRDIQRMTAARAAVVYMSFVPSNPIVANDVPTLSQRNYHRKDNYILQLLVITQEGQRLRKQIPTANRKRVLQLAEQFQSEVTNIDSNDYLPPAQQLYQLLITPIEPELSAQKIDNLVFIPDAGLRSLPIAALYDGQYFLVEKYSLGLMPSFSLTDIRYRDIKKAAFLAMGASQFVEQEALPAVPAELAAISKTRPGHIFLNEAFTLDNLKSQRNQQSFSILHLATHSKFNPGQRANSYIQLWDTKLRLDQLQQLKLNNPLVDLLVLSSCQTAIGDEQAELGFAGLAVQAGVKSVLASLWSVSDSGTLGLMSEFYQQLQTAPIKSEALRRTQVAMIRKQVRLEARRLYTSTGITLLPPELTDVGDVDLSHPYYWAAFTMIGNPW